MYDILIKNAVVITVDPEHHVYDRGFVAINGNIIAAIGPMEELDRNLLFLGETGGVSGTMPGFQLARREIDAGGKAVMPGLIDGHGHGGHCLIRTLGDQLEPWDAMAEDIYFRHTDDDFWYAEAALSAAEGEEKTEPQVAQQESQMGPPVFLPVFRLPIFQLLFCKNHFALHIYILLLKLVSILHL